MAKAKRNKKYKEKVAKLAEGNKIKKKKMSKWKPELMKRKKKLKVLKAQYSKSSSNLSTLAIQKNFGQRCSKWKKRNASWSNEIGSAGSGLREESDLRQKWTTMRSTIRQHGQTRRKQNFELLAKRQEPWKKGIGDKFSEINRVKYWVFYLVLHDVRFFLVYWSFRDNF